MATDTARDSITPPWRTHQGFLTRHQYPNTCQHKHIPYLPESRRGPTPDRLAVGFTKLAGPLGVAGAHSDGHWDATSHHQGLEVNGDVQRHASACGDEAVVSM